MFLKCNYENKYLPKPNPKTISSTPSKLTSNALIVDSDVNLGKLYVQISVTFKSTHGNTLVFSIVFGENHVLNLSIGNGKRETRIITNIIKPGKKHALQSVAIFKININLPKKIDNAAKA